MSEHLKCNLCGSSGYKILYPSTLKRGEGLEWNSLACSNMYHGSHHRIVRCTECGLIFSSPRDGLDEIEKAYKNVVDETYHHASQGRIRTFNRILRRPQMQKKGSLLDVGCYTGLFVKLAIEAGFEAMGIEPSSWASEIGRNEYGLNIINTNIYGFTPENKFNIITMWDVLEHLHDPYGALKICHDSLSDDGMLAISTMRCQGIFFSLCGKYWPWFMRMHLYYFTVSTLTRALEKSGFRVIAVHPYTHYVDAGYLFYKMSLSRIRFFDSSHNIRLKDITIPVQLGDFMEVYALRQ